MMWRSLLQEERTCCLLEVRSRARTPRRRRADFEERLHSLWGKKHRDSWCPASSQRSRKLKGGQNGGHTNVFDGPCSSSGSATNRFGGSLAEAV